MTQAQALEPVAIGHGEGDARWWLGTLAEIKITAGQTGGLLSVVEMTNPPHFEGPLHVHHREDETFWILDGDATIEVGDRVIQASAGDVVFGPRDIPHRYSVGPNGCRMLFIFTPGGLEEAIVAMSEPAAERTVPPPAQEPPDFERLLPIIEKAGAEILG